MRLLSVFSAMPIATSHLTARSILPGSFGRLTLIEPPSTPSAHFSESSRKFAGPNIASAMPSSNACGPFSIRLFLSGFEMIDLEGVLDADQVGQQPGAAPARDEAEEDLGQRERRHRGVDRAVGRR